MEKIIEDAHDLDCAMACILSETAEKQVIESGRPYVASTLFSDYALDITTLRKHVGENFLWHVHDNGTHLHMLDRNNIEREQRSYDAWKKNFLAFSDWAFAELNYRWGGENNPLDRIFYYDGKSFREVSRETALLIWQYNGLELIRRHEAASITAV